MLYMLGCAAGAPGTAMAGPAMAGMPGSPGAAAGLPSLTLGLALALFAGVIWAADRLLTSPAPAAVPWPASRQVRAGPAAAAVSRCPASGQARTPAAVAGGGGRPGPGRAAGPPMSPRLAACCEIVMGVAMSYMLITML